MYLDYLFIYAKNNRYRVYCNGKYCTIFSVYGKEKLLIMHNLGTNSEYSLQNLLKWVLIIVLAGWFSKRSRGAKIILARQWKSYFVFNVYVLFNIQTTQSRFCIINFRNRGKYVYMLLK